MIERVIIAGGGTGGHLFPGIAVLEELRRRNPALSVVFVGTEKGIEARVVPQLGEPLELLEVTPLKGRRPGELLKSLARLPTAVTAAAKLLKRHRPDLVLGVGGYASGPALAAAATMKIPTAILEQNAHVGLTNRVLAPLVGRAYVSFPETAARFSPDRVRRSGNPVRRAFALAARRAASDPEGFEARANTIFVLGGSQGARALNRTVPEALAAADLHGMKVLHQAGKAMRDEVQARYDELGVDAEVVSFIDDMAAAYASAALVICRAGATTVAELCAVGRPAIFVPYPHAADDHQAKNAESLAARGAAVCIRESALDRDRLTSELQRLLDDGDARRAMAEAARSLGRPDAAAAIVDDLCEWLGCPEAPATEAVPAESPDGDDGEAEGDDGAEGTEPGDGTSARRGLRGRRPYVPMSAHRAARHHSSAPPAPPLVVSWTD